MIVIPVKTDKPQSAVAPLFGHAKWFAVVDLESGNIEIIPNEAKGGPAVVGMLLKKGVKIVLTPHIGKRPFELLTQAGVEVYFTGNERIIVDDALSAHREKKFELIRAETVHLYGHSHGNNHHHH